MRQLIAVPLADLCRRPAREIQHHRVYEAKEPRYIPKSERLERHAAAMRERNAAYLRRVDAARKGWRRGQREWKRRAS